MTSDRPWTFVIVLPGGGYQFLADHEGAPIADWLRSIGVEAAVHEYPVGAAHPAALASVAAAIATVRGAGYKKVGVIGFSAGGHLAGLAALALPPAERVDFAILCYPVVSMIEPSHQGSRDNLLGPDPDEGIMRRTSLELLVKAQSPPMFLWQTADDEAIALGPLYRLAAALQSVAVPHSLHIYPTGRHGLALAQESGSPSLWTVECSSWLDDLGMLRAR